MRKYFLEFLVFITGAAIMIIEICGARILAPLIGSSFIVWTILIGIILGSLSTGYFLGGWIADKKPDYKTLLLVVFLSSISVCSVLLLRNIVFILSEKISVNLVEGAIFSTLVLFTLPNILLGMVSPIAARIKLKNITSSGKTIGNLYAYSTIGSIFGTFITGFYLLAYFRVTQIFLGISLILFFLSLVILAKGKRLFLFQLLLFVGIFTASLKASINFYPSNTVIIESKYSHLQVYDTTWYNNEKIRILKADNAIESAVSLSTEALVFKYTKFFTIAKKINPQLHKILMIGGGAYTVPNTFIKKYPDVNVDVVEIDPVMTLAAQKYFFLEKNRRLNIFTEDGRTFLNRESNNPTSLGQYDTLFIDAYKASNIPFQLTTIEAVQKMNSLLSNNGFVIANLVSAVEGINSKFMHAEYYTFKQFFPYIYIFPMGKKGNSNAVQNIMMVAFKSKPPENLFSIKYPGGSLTDRWTKEIKNNVPTLTDDFAPVDQYTLLYQF